MDIVPSYTNYPHAIFKLNVFVSWIKIRILF